MCPIKHLAERRRYIRLGKVRLGVQVEVLTETGKIKMRNGKPVMRPQATDYFVIKEEVEGARQQVLNIFGEEPKELRIRFLFDDEGQTFPQYLKMYRGDGELRCMGDGEYVYVRRYYDKAKKIDEKLISGGAFLHGRFPLDGLAIGDVLDVWQEQYGWGDEWNGENLVPCLGPECPQHNPRGCRPTGRLLFMIEGIERLGFWEMVVHQYALVGINSQLELCRAFTGQYLGRPTILRVPFILRLRGPEKFKVRVIEKGQEKDKTITAWIPEIEPDPEWVSDVVAGVVELPALPPAKITREDLWGEEKPKAIEPPAPEEEEPLDYQPGSPDDLWPDSAEGQGAEQEEMAF